jgi:O-succinylbenzoic acid--CoA ligase
VGANIAVVAKRTASTTTLIMALIETGRRAVLLHPRWTDRERADALAQVTEPMLVEDCDGAWEAAQQLDPAGTDYATGQGSVVVFTSGSTGASRGVELSAGVLAASARASAEHLGWLEHDRWLCCLPLAHVGGLSIVTRCWQGGRTTVLEAEGSFDPELVVGDIERHRVSLLSLVPTQLKALLEWGLWRPSGCLRAVLVGGAAATDELLAEAAERGLPVRPTYGLTETGSQVATWPVATAWVPGRGIGPPLPGVELAIRDDGRVAVRGEMTRAVGLPDRAPLTDEAGWLATGDVGMIDERGWLHVLGRWDHVIVTGGENVDPLTVEAALEQCPGIEAACVVGVPDRTWGEVVGAVVQVRDRAALDGLDDRLAAVLAPHARPRRIRAVDAIPLTVTGKPDRVAIAAML